MMYRIFQVIFFPLFVFVLISPGKVFAAVPVVSSVKITGGNQITVVYSEPVNSVQTDYTNISIAGAARSVVGISGSGSAIILINFDGATADTSATGTADILGTVVSTSTGDPITPVVGQSVSDGQAPLFTAVSITSNNASSTLSKSGDTAILTFTVSEPLSTRVSQIDGVGAITLSSGSNSYSAAITLGGGDAEGLVSILINVTDNAENRASATSTTDGTSLVYDRTPPNAPTVVSPSVATTYASTTIFTITGNAENGSTVFVSGGANTVSTSTLLESFSIEVPLNQNASSTLSLTARDPAGNISSATTTVIIHDNISPVLSSVIISSNNANPVTGRPNDTITISISSNEPIVLLSALVGGASAQVSGGPISWVAVKTMSSSDQNGDVQFSVSFYDLAGNTGFNTSTTTDGSAVNFDNTPVTPLSLGGSIMGLVSGGGGFFTPVVREETGVVLGTSTASMVSVAGPASISAQMTGKVLGTSTYKFIKSLGFGSKNRDVSELQKILISTGFLKSEVTWYFGSMTRAALKQFQIKYGIEPTGTVGPITRSLLNKTVF